MSLINEALKRTQGAQQQTLPPAGGPAFRPAEPVAAKGGSGARTLLFIMVFAVVVGNILLWIAFSDREARKAATLESPTVAAEIASTPAPAPQPAAAPVAPAVVPQTASVAPVAAPEVPVVVPAAEDITSAVVATTAPGPAPTVVFAEPPPPSVLRLQSIIYGSRPSAMIGGKFLFVGDRIQGHQVIAIDKQSVTLVGDGQTNTLSLQ